jgi:hypothetical protein
VIETANEHIGKRAGTSRYASRRRNDGRTIIVFLILHSGVPILFIQKTVHNKQKMQDERQNGQKLHLSNKRSIIEESIAMISILGTQLPAKNSRAVIPALSLGRKRQRSGSTTLIPRCCFRV